MIRALLIVSIILGVAPSALASPYATGTILISVHHTEPDKTTTKPDDTPPSSAAITYFTARNDTLKVFYTIVGKPDSARQQTVGSDISFNGTETNDVATAIANDCGRGLTHDDHSIVRHAENQEARVATLNFFYAPSRAAATTQAGAAAPPAAKKVLHVSLADPKGSRSATGEVKTTLHHYTMRCGKKEGEYSTPGTTPLFVSAPDAFELPDFQPPPGSTTYELTQTYDVKIASPTWQRTNGWSGTITYKLTFHNLPAAVIDASNESPLRGDTIELSGEHSIGDIVKGEWKFATDELCDYPGRTSLPQSDARVPDAAHYKYNDDISKAENTIAFYGPRANAADLRIRTSPLCSFTATLTISDGMFSGVASKKIEVKPRDWKGVPEFVDGPPPRQLKLVPPDYLYSDVGGTKVLGINIPRTCIVGPPQAPTAYLLDCDMPYGAVRAVLQRDSNALEALAKKFDIGFVSFGDALRDTTEIASGIQTQQTRDRVKILVNKGGFQGIYFFKSYPAALFEQTAVLLPYLYSDDFNRQMSAQRPQDPSWPGTVRNCIAFHEYLHTFFQGEVWRSLPAGSQIGNVDPATNTLSAFDPARVYEAMYDLTPYNLIQRAVAVQNIAHLAGMRADYDHEHMVRLRSHIFPPNHRFGGILDRCSALAPGEPRNARDARGSGYFARFNDPKGRPTGVPALVNSP